MSSQVDFTRDDIVSEIGSAAKANDQMVTFIKRELMMRDFPTFAREAWKIIEPGTPYSHNWHIDYLTEEVLSMFGNILGDVFPDADWDGIAKSRRSLRLNINVPTRSMKTVLISILIPCWLILHKPTLKFATVAYADDLATEINTKRRTIVESDWYQKHFGDLVVTKNDSSRKDHIVFTSEGSMYAVSIGGRFTGMGADVIIMDDAQKPLDMATESQRMKAISFFRDTLPTRLNDRNTGVIINIQQRLDFNDLTGYIEKNLGNVYQYVKIPLQASQDLQYVGRLTGTVWEYKQGEVLWDERMNHQSVQDLRRELGSRNFEAQQQQNPSPDVGALVNRAWLDQSRYEGKPMEFVAHMKETRPEAYAESKIILSWDMNYSVSADGKSDRVGFVAGLYDPSTESTAILEASEALHSFTQGLAAVDKAKTKYEALGLPIVTLIEKKANGGPIIEVLKQKIAGIVPFDPGTSNKEARVSSITGYLEAGNIRLPGDASDTHWLEQFLTQLVSFPNVDHDDMVDAFSQLLIYVYTTKKTPAAMPIVLFL